ncbi:MAG: polysaccharide biosynthesis/export family protein [Primorskyibacter sp.]
MPRSAALETEILRQTDADAPAFQVVEVTRTALPALSQWPQTRLTRGEGWINTHRGIASSVIKAGDRLTLTIWDSQANSLLTSEGQKSVAMSNLRVAPNGTIFIPYTGTIDVGGLTPTSARARVQSRLEPIVPSAQVQLALQEGQRNSVHLVSGVPAPGTYPLPSREYTILSLISAGGGVSGALRNPRVRLLRQGRTYEIQAQRLMGSGRYDTVLQGGDKVIIEEDRRSFTALGATGTQDVIFFPKDRLSVIEALSLMGGLSADRANPEGVLVLREYPNSQVGRNQGPQRPYVVFAINLTTADGIFSARGFKVQPGDTVLATESPINAAQTIFGLIGSAFGLGNQLAN